MADPIFRSPLTNILGLTDVGWYSCPSLLDLDGDGDLDAWVGNSAGDVLYYRNTGSATAPLFAAPLTNPFGLTNAGWNAIPAFADIDGDGDLDAFVGNNNGDTLFFENTGTASDPAFAGPVANPFGLTQANGWQAVPTLADIDSDGDLDAFIGDGYGYRLFFENTGTATTPAFAAPVASPLATLDHGDYSMRGALALDDIDNDGDLDALVGNGAWGDILFYENTGPATDPTFASPIAHPFDLPDAGHFTTPALTDLDGDGDPDLLIGNSDGNTLFFQNDAIIPPNRAPHATNLDQTIAYQEYTAAPVAPIVVTDPDLGELLTVRVTLGAGNGSLGTLSANSGHGERFDPRTGVWSVTGEQTQVNAALAVLTFIPVADSFADTSALVTISDGIAPTLTGTLVFNGTTVDHPLFRTPSTNPFGLTDVGSWASPTLADIDADGDLDAFVGNSDGNTLYFQNTGTITSPSFAAPSTNPFGLSDVGSNASPTLADMDGDGDLDLLVGNSVGNSLFFQNTGTAEAPSFAAPATNPLGLADIGGNATPYLIDMDGDGDLDALLGTADGNSLYFQNTGTTSAPVFAGPITNPLGLTAAGSNANPAFGDMDGDGDRDALVGNSDGNTYYYPNFGTPGSPAFSARYYPNLFGLTDVGAAASPALADLDGDGDLDALLGNDAGNILFYRNDTIAALNHAPQATNLDQTIAYREDDQRAAIADIVITDPDVGDPLTVTVTLAGGNSSLGSLTAASGHGETYNAATGVWTVTGEQTTVNAALAALAFVSVANGFADTSATVTISDGIAPNLQGTLLFNGTAINHPVFRPLLTNPFGLTDVGSNATPALADIDGDGDLDALLGNRDGNTLFYRNTGTALLPVFAAPNSNPFGLTDVGSYASPALVDIDGDGDLDALLGNSDGNTLFYRNTGTAAAPAFAAPSSNPFGLTDVGSYASPALADIDGDGDQDAFVGNSVGNTLFYLNTGTAWAPIFAAPVTNPFGLTDVGNNATPAFADMDGDGDLDALVGNGAGSTLYYKNSGTAASPIFDAPRTNYFGLTDVGDNARLTVADIEGDGDLDALVGDNNGNISFYRNDAIATNHAPQATNLDQTIAYLEDDQRTAIADIVITDPDVGDPLTVTVTLAGGNSSLGSLTAASGHGETYGAATGVWTVTGEQTTVNAALAALAFVPVANGFADTSATVTISDGIAPNLQGTLLFNGTAINHPVFRPPLTNPFGLTDVGSNAATPALADIDGDGDLDALLGNRDGNTLFYRNTGTALLPVFAAPSSNPFGLTDVGSYASPALVDVDGDGDLDALVGNSDGNTLFYRNTGTAAAPAFAAPGTNLFGLTDVGSYAAPALADIDGDGDQDAFVGELYGNTLFYLNTGTALTPIFAAPITNPFGLTNVGYWASSTFADLDDDGDLDALVGNGAGSTLYYTNSGTAASPIFDTPRTNHFGLTDVGDIASPAFADIDGDGDLDALVGDNSGNLSFYRNDAIAIATNHAPQATNLNQTIAYSEDTPAPLTAIVITDPDVGDSLTVTVTLASGNSTLGSLSVGSHGETYTPATGVWTVTGELTWVNAALAALAFMPVANGIADTSATVSIADGMAPALTGTLLFNGTDLLLNDAPAGTDSSVRLNENTSYTLSTADFGYSDLHDIPADTLQAVTIASLPVAGSLQLHGIAVTAGQSVSAADIAAGALVFTAAPLGAASTVTLTFQVQDNGGTANGGIDLDPTANTITFNVTAEGDPLFRPPLPFGLTDVGWNASPTLADLDGDGDLDALLGNMNGNMLFFQNIGTAATPVFTAPSTNPFGLTNVGNYASPTFADLDDDGDLDVLVGIYFGNTLLFENTGTSGSPVFAPPRTNPFGLADIDAHAHPTLADIDGDGDLDALVGNREGNTLLFENTGTSGSPVFAAPSTNPFGLTYVGYRASPTFADIDGDGDLDALVSTGGSTLFFRNTGTAGAPVFAAALANPFGLTDIGSYTMPTCADLDGDGDLDALLGNEDGKTWLFRNDAIAAPNQAPQATNLDQTIAFAGNAMTAITDIVISDPNSGDPLTVTVTMASGNSDLGALSADSGQGETYDPATGVWTMTATQAAVNTALAALSFVSGPNLFMDTSASITISDGIAPPLTGTLTFTETTAPLPPLFRLLPPDPFGLADYCQGIRPTFVDIDSDGDLDAFIGNADGNTHFHENTGTASQPIFAGAISNPFGLTDVGSNNSTPTFADMDGDGDLDLIAGNGLGNTLFFLNSGTAAAPNYAAPTTNPFGLTDIGYDASPTFADIDGDGDLDLLAGNHNGEILFFQNTGTATSAAFAAPIANPFGRQTGVDHYGTPIFADGLAGIGYDSSPTFADLDADGDLDALIGNDNGDTLFFRNTGTVDTPYFAAPSGDPLGLMGTGGWQERGATPAVADIDGDGDLDLFVGGQYGGLRCYRNDAIVAPNHAPQATNLDQTIAYTFTEGSIAATANIVVADLDPASYPLTATVTMATGNSALGSLTANSGHGESYDPETGVWTVSGSQQMVNAALADLAFVPVVNEYMHTWASASILVGNGSMWTAGPLGGIIHSAHDEIAGNHGGISTPATVTITLASGGTAIGSLSADSGQGETYNPATGVWTVTGMQAAVNTALAALSFVPLPTTAVDTSATVAITDGIAPALTGTLTFTGTPAATDPVFQAPSTNLFGLTADGSSPTFTDIDGDGDLDAFIGGRYGIQFFRNTGTAHAPTFEGMPSATPFHLTSGNGYSPAFADLDGDGDLDAFVGNDGDMLFSQNTGTAEAPVFAPPRTSPFGLTNTGLYDFCPTFADIDGDGDLDAFIGMDEGAVLFSQNTGTTGTPAFAAPIPNPFGLTEVFVNTGLSYGEGEVGPDTFWSASLAFADIDGDGDLDAFIGELYGHTILFRNTGTAGSPAFELASTAAFGAQTAVGWYASPTFADIDNDGDQDAFVGNGDGTRFFRNNSNGAPQATHLTQTIAYTEDTQAAIADIVVTDRNWSDTVTATVTMAAGSGALGTLTAGSGHGETYSPETGVWRVSGTQAAVNAALAALSFTPAANGFADTSAAVAITDGIAPALTGTLAFNGTPVNDAPVGANKTVTLREDASYTLTYANFGFSDPNDSPANSLRAVKISTLPATGTLTLDGVAVTEGQFVRTVDITGGKLVFTPAANTNGTTCANLAFQVRDNGGTNNDGVDLDPSPNTITFNVTAVNDAPAGNDNTVIINEGGRHTLSAADFGFSDLSDTPANSLLAVTITTLPTAGTLKMNGVAVTAGQSISAANIAAGKLLFTPSTNANGEAYASLAFQVRDNGGTNNGGIDLDPTPNTITFNVTPVNDAPAGANKAVTLKEDGGYTLAAADFGCRDLNDSPANSLLAVTITTLPTAGTLTLHNGAITAGQSVSVEDIAAGYLVFTPAANAHGSAYANLTFQVRDNGGTANGGADLDPMARMITFDVTAVNDVPTGGDKAVRLNEGGRYTLAAADFGFSDLSDSPANSLLAVTITTLPTSGTLKLNGVAVTAGQSVSAANITAGKLIFTPSANANGESYASLVFQVQDNGGTNNGGIDLDPTPNTITFNVTAVNDAPSGVSKTVILKEDGGYAFTSVDFACRDLNDTPANSLLAVTITTLPTAGTLKLNGGVVKAGQSVSAGDITAGMLTFTPAANANGTGYASLTFQVRDNGGTNNGGVDLDPTPNTITFNVTAVRDDLNLVGTAGDDILNGDLIDVGSYDTLSGLAGNDILNSGRGVNTLDGGTGSDWASYADASAGVTIKLNVTGLQNTMGAGTDKLIGIENLLGSQFNDSLRGNAGPNALMGGLGKDVLTGGGGPDTFVYSATAESGFDPANRDLITDFSKVQGDKIDVKAIDANTVLAGNQAWSFVADFTGAAGQVSFDAANHLALFDQNGDMVADFSIELAGISSLAASNFIFA